MAAFSVDGDATPLHFASQGCNDLEVFKMLIKRYPGTLVQPATSGYGEGDGMIPVEYAGRGEVLDKHLAFMSYLNAKDVWSHILRFLA